MKRPLGINSKVLVVYLVTLIPLVLVLTFSYGQWHRTNIRLLVEDRTDTARLTGVSFRLLIEGMRNSMAAVGRDLVDLPPPGPGARADLRQLAADYPLVNVVFTDRQGRVAGASDANLVGQSLARRPAFTAVLRGRASGIEPSSTHGKVKGFYVTQGLRGADGELQGVVGGLVDVARLSKALPLEDLEGSTNIIDSSGRVVFHSEFPELAREMSPWGKFPFVRRALAGRVATEQAIVLPPTNRARTIAAVPIKGIGWAAGASIDYAQARGPFRRALFAAVGVSILAAGIGLAVGLVIIQSILRAIGVLAAGARRLSQGSLDRPIIVRTNDELQDVAQSLNRARIDIQESIRALEEKDRAIRQAYSDVIGAVTGGKLILLTREEITAFLGAPVSPEYPIDHFKDLRTARERVRQVLGDEFGLTETGVFISPVGEAITNAVKHGGRSTYRVYRKDDLVQVMVADKGPGIDFRTLPKAALETGYSTVGTLGLGFAVMLHDSERVLLATGPEGTVVVLEIKAKKDQLSA